MKRIFTLSFCFFMHHSYCQTPTLSWEKSLGGSDIDLANCIYQLPTGESIVACSTRSEDDDVKGCGVNTISNWIIKLDVSGNIIWQKCFYPGYANSIKPTNDKGYIVAGVNIGDAAGSHGGSDAWVLKLDSSGNMQWQKYLGGSAYDEAFSIEQTADSGYIMASSTASNDGDVSGNHGKDNVDGDALDWWVAKLDKDGSITWQECLGGSKVELYPKVEQTFDKGYILTGTTASNDGDVTGEHSLDYDAWVVKLDGAGKIKWQECLGGTFGEDGKDIKQTADSGYILAASARSNNGDVTQNRGGSDFWVVKLTSTGAITWEKCYGGTSDDLPAELQIVNDGYVIAGSTTSDNGDITGFHGNYDYWLIKTDTLGRLVWEKTLGGENDDEAYGVSSNVNGTYLVAGFANSYTGDVTDNHGDIDAWIVKLTGPGVLPVSLVSFTAQKQGNAVQLKWQATNETNTGYYSIERSQDAIFFHSIGSKQSLFTGSVANYAFTDNAPLKGSNYYRIKQIDKDGKSVYSAVQPINFTESNALFSISPNPAKGFLYITALDNASNAQISITDLNGKILYTVKQNFVANQQLKITTSQFARQVLLVNIVTTTVRQQLKVTIE